MFNALKCQVLDVVITFGSGIAYYPDTKMQHSGIAAKRRKNENVTNMPTDTPAVPVTLNWDLWSGPAPCDHIPGHTIPKSGVAGEVSATLSRQPAVR
jgi:hypothetical protein